MLAQVAAAHDNIAARGGAAIGIAPAATYQARHLMETRIPFPLFLDPSLRVSRTLGIGTQSRVRYLLNLPAWWRWLRAFAVNRNQGRLTGHFSTVPGIAVVTAGGEVTFSHRGSGLGDYPPLGEVVGALDEAIGNRSDPA
jgi:hypothetical protein